ncbi:MAG: DUF393 domain-containing protein [Planctomycetaceae bacterium]|nr:DUF393 domain-containing protein [Planctomycetaceae bacterium]
MPRGNHIVSPAVQSQPVNRSKTPQVATGDPPIIFFDGVCGFCNRMVDFVLSHDRRGVFRFAPLQGETARALLPPADVESLDSVVLMLRGQTFRRSSASARILWELGPFWQIAGWLLWLIPLPLRDWGYRLVGKNRYRMFGKLEACRMPTPEERDRFLP